MYDNSEVNEGSLLQPSRKVKNVRLLEVSVDPEAQGKPVKFIFENPKTGARFQHMEFEPTRRENQEDTKFKNMVRIITSKVKHIFGRYISKEELDNIKEKSWTTYIKKHIELLPENYKEIPVHLKLVWRAGTGKNDGKYFVSFPNFPPFITSQAYPTIASDELFPYSEGDMFERPGIVPDVPDVSEGAGSSGTGDNDDVPF